jgi:hypothetical protein
MSECLTANRFLPMPETRVGDLVKIILPGERCWAEVLEVLDDRSIRVRIDNDVGRWPGLAWDDAPEAGAITPLHTHKFNDVVCAKWSNKDGYIAFFVVEEPKA